VVAALGALTAGSASAAVKLERSHAATSVHVPAAVGTLVQRLGVRESVLPRPQAARIVRANLGQRTLQAHSAFGGFVYCQYNLIGPGPLFDVLTWPVTDSGHDAVLTISNTVESTSADFSSGNDVSTDTWWAIQYAGSFYLYDSETAEFVDGPLTYMNAWTGWGFSDLPGTRYYELVNQALFYDDGTWSNVEQYVAPTFGAGANSATSCSY